MKSRLVAVVIALFVASMAMAADQPPAPRDKPLAEPLNQKLPRWLRFSGEYRSRVEGFTGGGFKPDNDDMYLLSRFRLTMKVQPTSWMKFVVQAQDAHVFGKNQHPAAAPYQDALDMRLGFVEFGDAERKPAYLRVGRQELAFGEERLLGSLDWANTARSFDAVRTNFRRGGYSVDAFVASPIKFHDGQFNEPTPGNLLYGVYGGIAKLVPKAKIEPYFFWRRQSWLAVETGGRGNMNFGTAGVRWAGQWPKNFDYGTEMAFQSGSLGADRIGAWAGHWAVGHTAPKWRLKPRVALEYNFASGDRNPKDGKRGTFDQLYPTGHDKYGLADQVGWRNIEHLRAGVELKPSPKWLIASRYNVWWLADSHDGIYDAAGNQLARVAAGTAGKFVGQELDTVAIYTLNRELKLGGGYGHIFPGTYLQHALHGAAYNYPYASATLTF